MRPILYESTETNFDPSTRSYGLGVLSDCVSCEVVESLNGTFELSMDYPITGIHYSDIQLDRIILAKSKPRQEQEQAFRIYDISRPMDGIVEISARHISYDLSEYVVQPKFSNDITVNPVTADNVQDAITALHNQSFPVDGNGDPVCPFVLDSDIIYERVFSIGTPGSYRSFLANNDGSLAEVFEGEWEFDNYSCYLHNKRGSDNGVKILYGVNLKDIKQEENIENMYTAVYPYAVHNNGSLTYVYRLNPNVPADVAIAPDAPIVKATGTFEREKILPLDISSNYNQYASDQISTEIDTSKSTTASGRPTNYQLYNAAVVYMQENKIGEPKIDITLSFIDVSEFLGTGIFHDVDLGDTVHVYFEKLGIETSSRCIKTKYNVLVDRYESLELGDSGSTLANTVASANNSATKANTTAVRARSAADQALSDAAIASAAASSATDAARVAGIAASVAQAAAEAAQDDIDEQKEYFWHDTNGAHVLGNAQNAYRNDIDSNGMRIIDTAREKAVAQFGTTTIIGEPDGARTEIDTDSVEWYLDEHTLVGGIYYGSSAVITSSVNEISIEVNTIGAKALSVSNGASVLTFPEIHLTCSCDYDDLYSVTGHIDVDRTFSIDPTSLQYESDAYGDIEATYELLYTYFRLPLLLSNGQTEYFYITIVTDVSYNLIEVNVGESVHYSGPFVWTADAQYKITGSATITYYQRSNNVGQSVSFGNGSRTDIIANAVNSHFPIRLGNFIRSDIQALYALMVGNGPDEYHRHTALTIDWNGNIRTEGGIDAVGDVTVEGDILATGNVFAANTSYIGMIIHSTTLSTETLVKSVYGGIRWIRHDGYFLRGASSGVTSGDQHNVSDGGAATHDHGAKTGSVTLSGAQSGVQSHGHGVYYKRTNITIASNGNTHVLCHSSNTGATNWPASNANAAGAVQKQGPTNATSGHDHSISSASNLPPYKNVYIWERVA